MRDWIIALRRIVSKFLLIALALPHMASASGIPEDGVLDFAILRNGEQIGRHVIRFERRGEPTIVRIVAEVDYRVAFIPLYTFRHSALETWRGGNLIAMSAETNDNGDDYNIELTTNGDSGALTVNGETASVAATSRPASLWNNAAVGNQRIVDPADGELMNVSVTSPGAETITVRGHEIRAIRYEMTGDFQRILWFDERNVLVQVAFEGEDGSKLRYVLR